MRGRSEVLSPGSPGRREGRDERAWAHVQFEEWDSRHRSRRGGAALTTPATPSYPAAHSHTHAHADHPNSRGHQPHTATQLAPLDPRGPQLAPARSARRAVDQAGSRAA